MENSAVFEKAIIKMKSDAPPGGDALRLECCYFDDAMQVKTFYRKSGDWINFDCEGFSILDICEGIIEVTHTTENPWTVLLMDVNLDNKIEVTYKHGDPSMFTS